MRAPHCQGQPEIHIRLTLYVGQDGPVILGREGVSIPRHSRRNMPAVSAGKHSGLGRSVSAVPLSSMHSIKLHQTQSTMKHAGSPPILGESVSVVMTPYQWRE
jgi:hypothetical protein